MMLRVNGEFLDFNDFVDVEKRVKLFEKIDETLGDFSYAFNLNKTAKNLKILGIQTPDVKSKRIYREVQCDLLNESGKAIHKGFLKVERIVDKVECSFFSGNYNWIKLLNGQLSDLDFSDLDTELNLANISNSWHNETGIIFPLIDTGALVTRSYQSLMVEDFSGCIFVKDVVKRIFQNASIKTNGDLFSDPIFNTLLISRNTKSQDDIDNRTSYVKNDFDQPVIFPGPGSDAFTVVFDNDNDYPFHDGSNNNFSTVTSKYTADVKIRGRLNVSINLEKTGGSPSDETYVRVVRNSTVIFSDRVGEVGPAFGKMSFSYDVTLDAGDQMFIRVSINQGLTPSTRTVKANSTFEFTPKYIYFTSGKSLLPKWTQAQFISNILAPFCAITDYEPVSKILTIDLFEGIKSKEPIDISQHIQIQQEDYSDFISDFGKESILTYQESDADEFKEYNLSEFISYGNGKIDVDNNFIQNSSDILTSDFKAPVSYLNGVFSASLERTNFVDLEETDTMDFTSVSDNSGNAQFNVDDATLFNVGELVRISESTESGYNGDYVISSKSGTWIVVAGNPFTIDATGKLTKVQHTINNDDGVYLLINTKYYFNNVSRYSRLDAYSIWNGHIGDTTYTDVGYAFFNLLNTGTQINQDYKQGLSFGGINNPLSYQYSLIDKYWGTVGRVLNDPVKLLCVGTIPQIVFDSITPLRPAIIKTEKTNNLYYFNRIGGYKESYLPCEVDLIKLS